MRCSNILDLLISWQNGKQDFVLEENTKPAYCTCPKVSSCKECDLASNYLDCKGMFAIDVAGNVRKAREAAGLTQRELSLMCQIPEKQIAIIESGFQDMSLTHLLKIALVLGISGKDLLN